MKVTAKRNFKIAQEGNVYGVDVKPEDTFEIDDATAKALEAEGYVTIVDEYDAELEGARATATELGIKVDGRWKLPRLQDEIAKAEAAKAAAGNEQN